jgi:hypothetical protein
MNVKLYKYAVYHGITWKFITQQQWAIQDGPNWTLVKNNDHIL